MTSYLTNSYAAMLRQLSALTPLEVDALATPEQLEALVLHLKEIARIVDTYTLTCGMDAKTSVTGPFDVTRFHAVMLGALEGEATYELAREAERIRNSKRGRRPRLVVSR